MLKRKRNARCTAVADSVLINSRTQNVLCCIVAILLSTDAAARLCARRAFQRWYLKIQDLFFQMLCRSFTYHVQFRKYRRTKLESNFLNHPVFLSPETVIYQLRLRLNRRYIAGCISYMLLTVTVNRISECLRTDCNCLGAKLYTGILKMIVRVLTTCHTQYT